MKWIEVVGNSADQFFMQGLTGTTGLTQKEAIFEIIKSVLGIRYRDGLDVRPFVLQRNNYGRKEHSSVELDLIVQKIVAGIEDGTIPSERYGDGKGGSSRYGVQGYARRIALYWLRKDRRLNGGSKPGVELGRDKIKNYQRLRDSDPQLKAMLILLEVADGNAAVKKFEIERFISNRKIALLIECLELKMDELPDDVLLDFGLNSTKTESQKAA